MQAIVTAKIIDQLKFRIRISNAFLLAFCHVKGRSGTRLRAPVESSDRPHFSESISVMIFSNNQIREFGSRSHLLVGLHTFSKNIGGIRRIMHSFFIFSLFNKRNWNIRPIPATRAESANLNLYCIKVHLKQPWPSRLWKSVLPSSRWRRFGMCRFIVHYFDFGIFWFVHWSTLVIPWGRRIQWILFSAIWSTYSESDTNQFISSSFDANNYEF
jgi:hypothetical protein